MPSVPSHIRQNSVSTKSTSSESSHVRALDTALSQMDTETLIDTELELTTPGPSTPTPKEQTMGAKPKTKLYYGGIPTDPAAMGLQLFSQDPEKYKNCNKLTLGKEIKAGNIKKFTFTNKNFIHSESKIKQLLEGGSIEVTGSMIQYRHRSKE